MRFSLKGHGQKRIGLKTPDFELARVLAEKEYQKAVWSAEAGVLQGKTSFSKLAEQYLDRLDKLSPTNPKHRTKYHHDKGITAIAVTTNPDIGPGGRNNQCFEARNIGIRRAVAVLVEIRKSAAALFPPQPALLVRRKGQGGCGTDFIGAHPIENKSCQLHSRAPSPPEMRKGKEMFRACVKVIPEQAGLSGVESGSFCQDFCHASIPPHLERPTSPLACGHPG
jgi:hypothetical protein